MVKSAGDISSKQIRRSVAAAGDYAEGVRNPEVSWKEATVRSDAKRKAAVAKAEAEGKWLKRVQQTSNEEWQNKAATVGAERYGPGVQANADKIEKFWNIQQPQIDALQKAVNAMPDETEENRKARLLANFEGMKNTGFTKGA